MMILQVTKPEHLKIYSAAVSLMTARVVLDDYDFYYEVGESLFLVQHLKNNTVCIEQIKKPDNYSELKAYGIIRK